MPTRKKSTGNQLRSEQQGVSLEEYEKGIRLFQQKDFAKAIPRFQAVLDQFPEEAALGDRARVYLRICKSEGKDREPLRQTRTPDQYFEVGVFLLNEGDFKEALRHLEKAVEHDPKDPHAHIGVASARMGSGDQDGALEALRKACAVDPNARVWVQAMSDFDDLEDNDAYLDLMHGD